jgi:hypothetical protein
MHKKARVSPKNIQFTDDIQIKEIPRDDLEKKESWDPYVTEVRYYSFFSLILINKTL